MNAPISTREPQNRDGTSELPAERGMLGYDELLKMNAYWRAANYLPWANLFIRQSALARTADARPRKATGGRHWGTTPGQTSFTCIEQGHQEV